jgi:hypothetical protein
MDPNSIKDHIYSREYLLKQGGIPGPEPKNTADVLTGRGYLLPENGSVKFLSAHNSFSK